MFVFLLQQLLLQSRNLKTTRLAGSLVLDLQKKLMFQFDYEFSLMSAPQGLIQGVAQVARKTAR